MRHQTHHEGERGFTLIELMVTMSVLALVMAIGVGPWQEYQRSAGQRDAVRQIVGVLRAAQVAAVAEVRLYHVDISPDGSDVTAYRTADTVGDPDVVRNSFDLGDDVGSPRLALGSFAGSSPTRIEFYPRGSASAGSVRVVRPNSTKAYTIYIEGLTARVSYDR